MWKIGLSRFFTMLGFSGFSVTVTEPFKTVHLSAKDNKQHHLPIDNFCKEVASYLIENKWDGNIILEYLFEFHSQLITDLETLKRSYNQRGSFGLHFLC